MYGCESWIIRKAEHQRIDAFKLWCWRRLLRVPWPARRSNQSILKEISLKYSLEGLMLKLKLQYLGHLIWRTDSLEKTDTGKDWRQGEKGMRCLDGITNSMNMSLSKLQTGGPAVHGITELLMAEWLNWTELLLVFSCQVVSDSFETPLTVAHQVPLSMDFPGKNTGVGCHFTFQGILLTQELNLSLLHWQADSLPLSHQESLYVYIRIEQKEIYHG